MPDSGSLYSPNLILYFKLNSLERRLIPCSSRPDVLPMSAASLLLAMCTDLERRHDGCRSEKDLRNYSRRMPEVRTKRQTNNPDRVLPRSAASLLLAMYSRLERRHDALDSGLLD